MIIETKVTQVKVTQTRVCEFVFLSINISLSLSLSLNTSHTPYIPFQVLRFQLFVCVRAVCVCACVHVCGLLYRSLSHTRKPHKHSRLYCADIGSGGTRCASDATVATTGAKRTHSTSLASESTEHDSVGERGEGGSIGGWNGGERERARNERESERERERPHQ